MGLDPRVSQFFNNYIVGRKTKYLWNNSFSYYFDIYVGIRQGSALFPTLSAFYLSLIFYVFEKKSLYISNSNLFCNYRIMSCLLKQFGLVIEHRKTKVFHFSRYQGIFNPLLLDLFFIEGLVLCSKESWRYLGFIFDRRLSFHQHIDFYTNKNISTVKSMKILGNLSRSLILSQKYLLYRLYALLIILYRFLLWFYNNTPLSYLLKVLRVM